MLKRFDVHDTTQIQLLLKSENSELQCTSHRHGNSQCRLLCYKIVQANVPKVHLSAVPLVVL